MEFLSGTSWFPVLLSLRVALVATAAIVLTAIPVAYVLARKNFWGKEIVDVLCTMPLVLPPTVTGYFLIVIFGRHGLLGEVVYEWTGWTIMFTWYAAALASFIVAFPLMLKTARASIESVDPTLIKASFTLGHSEWETALRVILPLSRKGLFAGIALSFARAMGEFGATLMIAGNIPGRTDTMPLAIYSLSAGGEWTAAQWMVILMTVISGIFLYAANRFAKRIL